MISSTGPESGLAARWSALAVLAVSTVAVYLAARHFGPLAAAFVAGAGTLGVVLICEGHAARVGRALERQGRLASLDDLTGLANDRSFRETLRSARDFRALALLDVDRFKPFNDAFGHPAGDAALQTIGAILAGCSAGSARVFRVGGDEFAVLFPVEGAPDPASTAGTIVRAVAEHPWPLRPITVSVGLATGDPDDHPGLLDRADRALYLAKREGGNRVSLRPVDGPQTG